MFNKGPFYVPSHYGAEVKALDFVLENQLLCSIPVVFKLHFLGPQDPAVTNQRLRETGEEQGKEKAQQMGFDFSTPGQPEQLCCHLFEKLGEGDGICKKGSASEKSLKTTLLFYNHRELPNMPAKCCIKGRTNENIPMLIG